jgi:small-conductance mechanosensitive channel
MDKYSILVFLHVASVIVWIGVGSTVALAALYAQRGRDHVVLERLGGWVAWITPRVLAPSALAALGFGIAAAHQGHWPRFFFFHLGEAAFAISFLLTIVFRLPLLRRVRRGSIRPERVARLTLALALLELTVLFLAVADMVAKPTTSDTAALVTGGAILGTAVLASIVVGFSGRSRRTLVEIVD